MIKKILLPVLVSLFCIPVLRAQVSIKDSAIFVPMVYATYTYQFPGGDVATRFGSNSSIGGGLMFKIKSNWIFGAEGNYLFGGMVKNQDELLQRISTHDGYVIDANGFYSDLAYYERGYDFYAKFGKLFSVLAPNPNSGIVVMAGVGYLEHKIRIHSTSGNDIPQLSGDYLKGYDHLSNGFSLNGSLGYMYLGSTRLLNFYLGFEFTQAWTRNKRDRDFDTGLHDGKKYSDQFYGIKADWIIPLYKRTPKAYYYY
ncbi:MAG TPA: hypothetical protein VMC08_10240 [Bacteroidales bacterium]|nr:hypothetical protein [Bacteroidales bacterium]